MRSARRAGRTTRWAVTAAIAALMSTLLFAPGVSVAHHGPGPIKKVVERVEWKLALDFSYTDKHQAFGSNLKWVPWSDHHTVHLQIRVVFRSVPVSLTRFHHAEVDFGRAFQTNSWSLSVNDTDTGDANGQKYSCNGTVFAKQGEVGFTTLRNRHNIHGPPTIYFVPTWPATPLHYDPAQCVDDHGTSHDPSEAFMYERRKSSEPGDVNYLTVGEYRIGLAQLLKGGTFKPARLYQKPDVAFNCTQPDSLGDGFRKDNCHQTFTSSQSINIKPVKIER